MKTWDRLYLVDFRTLTTRFWNETLRKLVQTKSGSICIEDYRLAFNPTCWAYKINYWRMFLQDLDSMKMLVCTCSSTSRKQIKSHHHTHLSVPLTIQTCTPLQWPEWDRFSRASLLYIGAPTKQAGRMHFFALSGMKVFLKTFNSDLQRAQCIISLVPVEFQVQWSTSFAVLSKAWYLSTSCFSSREAHFPQILEQF